MGTRNTTQEYRLSQWLPIVKACRSSGMTVKSWCEENNVNEKRFYYWQSRLRALASESLTASNQQESTFVPLALPAAQTSNKSHFTPAIVIKVGETAIELASDAQPELLASVLKVLKHAQ